MLVFDVATVKTTNCPGSIFLGYTHWHINEVKSSYVRGHVYQLLLTPSLLLISFLPPPHFLLLFFVLLLYEVFASSQFMYSIRAN